MADPAAPALAGGKSRLQATPQNPLLGLLARALYKARDVLSPAEGSLAARKGFNIADFVLGDAPEEVENWSYGNKPLTVPPLSRIPQAKTTVVERDGKKERKNRAFMALDAAAFAPAGALDSLAGGGVKGAVRLGGAPEAVATHTTDAAFGKITNIRDNGLYAPSIGLTAKSPSDYHSINPHLVWRAGELDRQFPDSAPPGIFNRDAFTWNPSRHIKAPIEEQFKSNFLKNSSLPMDQWAARLSDLLGDARLTQMAPDTGSHTASILASPSFRSLAEWETSPYGMGALESMGGGPGGLQTVQNYNWTFEQLAGKHNLYGQQLMQLLEQFPQLQKLSGGINLDLLRGSPLGDLYTTARNAPSAMGEMKIYAPSVPAGPDVASVYIPPVSSHMSGQWKDAGYDVYDLLHLQGLAGDLNIPYSKAPLNLLAPASGAKPPSPAEALRMFEDLKPKGPAQVGAPGLKAPAASWPPGIDKPLSGMQGNNESLEGLVSAAEASWQKPSLIDDLPDPDTDIAAQAAQALAAKAPSQQAPTGLWPETLEWFKSDTDDDLATYLAKYHDLPEDQISALKAIWAKASTGEQGAKDMQAYIKELAGDLE